MSFNALILRNMLRQRMRSSLTILGISIGIMTVVTLGAITEGMKATMEDLLRAGDADFMVGQKGSADFTFSIVSEEEWQGISERDDVLWAHGVLMHILSVESNPYFVMMGIRPGDLAESPPEVVAGSLLAPDASDQIVLGEQAAGDLGVGVGDHVTIDAQEFAVVGIYRTGMTWQDSGAYADLRMVQQLASRTGMVTAVYVKVAPGASVATVAASIEQQDDQLVSITSLADFAEVDQGSQMIDSANLAISALAVGIGAIGVMNTMIMSVFERTREIGILRAVGWRGRRILRMIVTESLLLCLVAVVVGVALGYLATQGVMLMQTVNMFLEPQYTIAVLLRGLGVAVVVALMGAIYPSIRAVRLTPMEALRHE
jgi:putative ABC transport system permease protein